MEVKDIFAKPIDRNIQGVIKVGQHKKENIKQELEEYVVTDELQGHFQRFFAAYSKGIVEPNDKMGVWISGFFGSGKSHFLKILSYLLANEEVEPGKFAIDYFEEDKKITLPNTLEDMKISRKINTDVILFNIDSKSDAGGKKDRNGIVNVFLKVFNDMQGYYGSIPFLADLERRLDQENKYLAFKEAFKEVSADNAKWDDVRNEFSWIQDEIKEALLKINFMSESAIDNFFERSSGEYSISIDEFAQRVNEYIEKKDEPHRVAFLIDEVGQYIGGNRDLTLNLQTVVEDLGRITNGKAWVIVTSQEAIDDVTSFDSNGANDFSKIKDRFATTLSLSSSNADEVIKQRILKKTAEATNVLRAKYELKETELKNKIIFQDGPELKLYKDDQDFAEVYPFVPYQFKLLGQILTEIRKHSYSGSNLSSGERSLLAMFKESAERNMNNEIDILVSLDQFYTSLERWIDSSHRRVIMYAVNNENINPMNETNNFTVNVLKTLFMIKYVDKAIKPTVDNITSLMIRSIEDDRLDVKEKVEEALKLLQNENLVQKNLDHYIFLTDEEQEINREIKDTEISPSDITAKISELVFDELLPGNSYKYPRFNGRYVFNYNRSVDSRPHTNTNFEITIQVITPNSFLSGKNGELMVQSADNSTIFVDLPNDKLFMEELTTALKLNKYLQLKVSSGAANFESIKRQKREDLTQLNMENRRSIEEALKESTIYFLGAEANLGKKEFSSRINEALEKMVNYVYYQLELIDSPKSNEDIQALFTEKKGNELFSDNSNENAIAKVEETIGEVTRNHATITIKYLKDLFVKKAPYGFVNADIEWILAKLFKEGRIALIYNGNPVQTTANRNEIIDLIQNNRMIEKVKVEKRERATEAQKRMLAEIAKELFQSKAVVDDNDDQTMLNFKEKNRILITRLKSYLSTEQYYYPDQKMLEDMIPLLESMQNINHSNKLFKKLIEKEEDLLEFAEDLELLTKFHATDHNGKKSVLKEIWISAQKDLKMIDASVSPISDRELINVIDQMREIFKQSKPYNSIAALGELHSSFTKLYEQIRDSEIEKAKIEIQSSWERVIEILETKSFKSQFILSVNDKFRSLLSNLETLNTVDQIIVVPSIAERTYTDFITRFDDEENRLIRKREAEIKKQREEAIKAGNENTVEDEVPEIFEKERKTIRLRNLVVSNRNIETPEEVHEFVQQIEQKLLEILDDRTIITIDL